MLKFIVLLLVPLVVFAISENSDKSTTSKKKSKKKQNAHKAPETPKIEAPGATTQLDLFLDDEDFDIVDLINADRRSK